MNQSNYFSRATLSRGLASIVFLGLIFAISTSSLYQVNLESKQQSLVESVTKELKLNKLSLDRYFENASYDVLSLAQSKTFRESLDSDMRFNDRVIELFELTMKSNPDFIQLRFIDANGKEIIRYNRESFGAPFIRVRDEYLQNKGHRGYFQEGMTISPESFAWSSIDLNRERGEIEKPIRPTRRLVYSVSHEGQRVGVFVANLSLQPIKDLVFNDFQVLPMFLVDRDGYYLWNTLNPVAQWTRDLAPKSKRWDFPSSSGVYSVELDLLRGMEMPYHLVVDARRELEKTTNEIRSKVLLQGLLFALVVGFVALILWLNKSNQLKRELESDLAEAMEKEAVNKEIQLRQARYATMGEMMAMFTDQWRQSLKVVRMNSDLIRSKLKLIELSDEDNTFFEGRFALIKEMRREQDDLINDFREFSDPNKEHAPFDVLSTIDAALNLLDSTLFQVGCIVRKDVQNEELIGIQRELEQVIINLLHNAVDVFRERKIKAPQIHLNAFVEHVDEQSHYVIRVEDNAGGIGADIIDKLFDAYSLTKSLNGSGLGLYISRIIIQDTFNGQIQATNGESGAIFEIRLPMPVKAG